MCYFITDDGIELTEEEVNKILSLFPFFDSKEDINLMTPMELEEILSGRRYSLYYHDEVHGY